MPTPRPPQKTLLTCTLLSGLIFCPFFLQKTVGATKLLTTQGTESLDPMANRVRGGFTRTLMKDTSGFGADVVRVRSGLQLVEKGGEERER